MVHKAKLCLFFLVLFLNNKIVLADPQEYDFSVDPKASLQKFEGWGMSLAWYANTIFPGNGKVSDWKHWDSMMEMLYSPNELGFNIVRYNIGGGENPAFRYLFKSNASYPNENYLIQGFLKKPGEWDWSADQTQILMLKKAKELGANIFEAFSNSPPYFWLKSGSVTGAIRPSTQIGVDTGAYDNLLDAHYDDFANYLAEVLQFFRDEHGIHFRTVDALNEPRAETGYWLFKQDFPNGKVQEGCHFNISHQIKMINAMYRALKDHGLSTEISASDDTGINYSLTSFEGYDAATRKAISQVNTHSYIAGNRLALRALAAKEKKRLWMSEFGTNDPGLNGALEFAQNIRADIKDLGAQAWIIWQPDWGLLDLTGLDQVSLRKQFYVMKQYSHFIRPGYQILGNSDWGTITAYDEKTETLVFVTLNKDNNDALINADLTKFTKLGSKARIYVTDANHNMQEMTELPVENAHIRYPAGHQSVTTIVVSATN